MKKEIDSMSLLVKLTTTKNAIGAKLHGNEFEFTLYDHKGIKVDSKTNNATGITVFNLHFNEEGTYHYTFKETKAPTDWIRDTKEYPVVVKIIKIDDKLTAHVTYPDGLPGFVNRLHAEPCSKVEFHELSFDKEGTYEYTLKELTPSGDGWTTDDAEFKVVVTVEDDGYGNLFATVKYPDGFPEFTNKYEWKSVKVIISAKKIAVGKELPCGKFKFGLFDKDDKLVATAFNE